METNIDYKALYEKKYTDLVAKLKEWHDGLQDGAPAKETLEFILPDLKESEDERIRKFLLDHAIEMIAGLESDISLSTYDGIKGHDPDAESELNQWQKARAYLEKKEQKPALKQTLEAYKISAERVTAEVKGRIEGRQDVINNPEYYGLSKPAEWSEEDKKY